MPSQGAEDKMDTNESPRNSTRKAWCCYNDCKADAVFDIEFEPQTTDGFTQSCAEHLGLMVECPCRVTRTEEEA